MILPDYWLPRPAMDLDKAARAAFDELLDSVRAAGGNAAIEYTLAAPKWQFLCYAADRKGMVVHGTGDAGIRAFEPRKAMDLNDFGNRKAVYAAGDGLWAMFYAVIDRERWPMSLANACFRLTDAAGAVSGPFYVFSISASALRQSPWRTGSVYLLPADTFEAQPLFPFGDYQVDVPQLASPAAVTPLARLEIAPEDFPFLSAIRGHEDERLQEYAHAMQTGGPWPE